MIALLAPTAEPSDYAWAIVVDHLFNEAGDPEGARKSIVDDESGTYGPSRAPDDLVAALERRSTEEGRQVLEASGIRTAVFKMHDDDGELYYTGVLAYRVTVEGEEHVVAAPLADFGMPNAGCTTVEYPGHSNWSVG